MPDQESSALRHPADPSTLTTQQILRESSWLRELIETRLEGMDKAINLLQAHADSVPTTSAVDADVRHLKEMMEQRFKDGNTALDAALTSKDRAIEKQEDAFTKQIDGIEKRHEADKKAVDDKVNDLKERLTSMESHAKGGAAMWGIIVGGLGLVIAASTLVILFAKTST